MTLPPTAVGFESPSLRAPGDGTVRAFEMKFLLDEAWAGEVEHWARERLAVDPHGDPALGGAYRTVSIYCDTPDLDVYHRSRFYRHSKFRVRRYSAAPWVFLERKSRWADRVAKRRTAVPEAELSLLAHPMSLLTWPGHWFHGRLWSRRLAPAARISYERTAFGGLGAEGPLRLTLDRHVRGVLASEWSLAPFDGGLPLLSRQVILELKFRAALPMLFKELLRDLRLSPRAVSKYRLCRDAWASPVVCPEVANARLAAGRVSEGR